MADQDWKTGGLNRNKYVVRKTCCNCDGTGIILDKLTFFESAGCSECDGSGSLAVDKTARYFVLRIDGGPNGAHDPNARKALACYADSVESDNPEFAEDIRAWLAEALRQLKDLNEMPLPEPNMENIAEAKADFAAGRCQTPQEIIDALKAKEPEEPTPGIVESYVIEKTAICKQCDESIRWTGKYWEHTGTRYRHPGQPKGEDA